MQIISVTKKDVYPLPRIDDILDALEGAAYFTMLDLASGYWQIGMSLCPCGIIHIVPKNVTPWA